MQSSEETWSAAFCRGRNRWSGVDLTLERFVERCEALGVRPEMVDAHVEELFLALACAEGNAAALGEFERRHLSRVSGYVRRFGLPADLVEEVKQKVRVKLLVGTNPGIARYAAQGPLDAFVRVTAVRSALDVAAAPANERENVFELAVLDGFADFRDGPELATIKNLNRERFRAVLEESLSALDAHERTLLRLTFVDRLNIDAIGLIYRAHRATIARRLVRIRTKVLEDFRRRFELRWGTTPSEVRSLVRLLGDDIQLSVGRLLASQSDARLKASGSTT
jgi:RNA polymerase sigma-70 factor (ECF subfamily)